jgi:GNAT superfamily N-acetyltransferase
MGGLFLHSPTRAEVEPIVVSKRLRGSGVGRALLDALVEAARAEGVQRVLVRPVARNAPAIRFFHAAGFDVLGHVDLQLELTEAWSYEQHERLADRPFRV